MSMRGSNRMDPVYSSQRSEFMLLEGRRVVEKPEDVPVGMMDERCFGKESGEALYYIIFRSSSEAKWVV
jgi:hypothetical protein